MAKGNLRVEGLCKYFGSVLAVNNVSFEARAGEFVTLLGPSGCGKSTTLRMIGGLEKPDQGSIYVGDKLLTSAEQGIFVPPEKRGMGMVFQNYAVWPHMTVYQNVAFPLQMRKLSVKEIRERVMHAIETVGLKSMENRPATLLSGGQQQRVALARALVSEPSVLLLDEPLSNLDARLRAEMRYELKELQRRLGITTLFVTHDQLEAMSMSDRVFVMNAGVVEQEGTPPEVYQTPSSRFVMEFLGKVNYLPARVVAGTNGALVARANGAGSMEAPLPGGQDEWESGQEVVIAFRAEDVTIVPVTGADASRVGSVTGVIHSAVYLGTQVEYLIEVGDTMVHAYAPATQRLPEGASVYLNVSADSVRVWPRERAKLP